jgi:hypothetical protein
MVYHSVAARLVPHFRRRLNRNGKREQTRRVGILDPTIRSSSLSSTTDMSFLPPLPPGMPLPPPGMPPPPPGMPPVTSGDPSSSRIPPEVLAVKSQKWIQMQKKRYGQKRKGGYVDMGKQVNFNTNLFRVRVLIGFLYRICLLNMSAKL